MRFLHKKSEVLQCWTCAHSGVHAIMYWRTLWQKFCHHSCIFTAEKRCYR